MKRLAAILILLFLALPRLIVAQESDTLSALVGVLKESNDPQFHLDILKGISEALSWGMWFFFAAIVLGKWGAALLPAVCVMFKPSIASES